MRDGDAPVEDQQPNSPRASLNFMYHCFVSLRVVDEKLSGGITAEE